MAWIELHQTLPRHPKLLRLANRLRVHPAQAAGHLTFLWLWALDYAPSGDVSTLAPAEISAAACFPGDAELFAKALQDCGWLDDGGQIHDWSDYGGRYASIRDGNRDRKRRSRSGHASVTRDMGVTSQSGHCDGHEKPRDVTPLQDRTGQDRTEEGRLSPAGACDDGPSVVRKPADVWPTLAEVLAVAGIRGLPSDCAEKWWLEHDARGGVDGRGQNIARWESSLQAYAVTWRANEQRDRQRRTADGRPNAESRQIAEAIPLPMIAIPPPATVGTPNGRSATTTPPNPEKSTARHA